MTSPAPSLRDNLKAAPLVGRLGRQIAGIYRRKKKAVDNWWSQGIGYPALIDVRKPWHEYEAGLRKKGLYELKASSRLNADCEYEALEHYDAELVRHFISVWEGFYRLPPDFSEEMAHSNRKGWLRGWAARRNGEPVSIHFIEQYGHYALCLPPFYDKSALRSRSFGTYMWFQLIRRTIADSTLDFLDLGGGPVADMPAGAYKLRYNPQDLGYRIKTCLHCGYMWPFKKLTETIRCKNCGRSVGMWRYAARLKFSRDEW